MCFMDCKEAQIMLIPHIMGDLIEDTPRRYHELSSHLLSCPTCAEEYADIKEAIAFIKRNKAIFAKALRTPEEKKAVEQKEILHSWKCIEAKLDEFEAQGRKEKRARFHRLLIRVSAVAACLVIGVFTCMVFSIYSKQKIAPELVSDQAAFIPKQFVKIELLSKDGNILIPAIKQIASNDEIKVLVINGKHFMTMNINTVLAVEPLVEQNNIGCLVKLHTGRIFAHAQHDGNPFIVDTIHGKAVITGTTFDIEVKEDNTTLVVSEGTVKFESENGVVEISAGQKAEIVRQSAPTSPTSCNASELMAWVTGYIPGSILAQTKSDADSWYISSLSLRKEPIVLERTSYDLWIEQSRDWFKQNFPWIFQLKEALAKEGVEIDFPELLIKTGDVWQFVCVDVQPARFSMINPNTLVNVASDYGFGKQWLLENIPTATDELEKPILSKNSITSLKAFERWLDYYDETNELEPPVPFYSYLASKYLANTRSLIWFAIRDGKYDLTDEERAEVLTLLQDEITAAGECQNEVFYPRDKQKLFCDDRCQESINNIIGYMTTLKAIEVRIAEYEFEK